MPSSSPWLTACKLSTAFSMRRCGGHWTDRVASCSTQFQHSQERADWCVLDFINILICGGRISWLHQSVAGHNSFFSSRSECFVKTDAIAVFGWFQAIGGLESVRGSLAWEPRAKSASCRLFFERSTPICSTRSSVSRSLQYQWPQVVRHWYWRIPRSHHELSPPISVTMCLSSRRKIVERLDLPTGRPMIAVEIAEESCLSRSFGCVRSCSNSSVFLMISDRCSPTSSYSGCRYWASRPEPVVRDFLTGAIDKVGKRAKSAVTALFMKLYLSWPGWWRPQRVKSRPLARLVNSPGSASQPLADSQLRDFIGHCNPAVGVDLDDILTGESLRRRIAPTMTSSESLDFEVGDMAVVEVCGYYFGKSLTSKNFWAIASCRSRLVWRPMAPFPRGRNHGDSIRNSRVTMYILSEKIYLNLRPKFIQKVLNLCIILSLLCIN